MAKIKTYPAFIIMSVVVVLDQISKTLVRNLIHEGEWIALGKGLWGDTLELVHLKNSGAAFSLSLPNPVWNRVFFVTTTILAVIFILWLLRRATHKIQVVAFGLILGGAVGNNLIDRLFLGAVTDFISIDIPNLIPGMDRWPVFNIADSSIFIAVVLLIFDMLFIREKKGVDTASEPQHTEIESNNQGVIDEKSAS